MRNIWRIFKTDMKHLFNNSITVIIVIGLVFLPSIFHVVQRHRVLGRVRQHR